MPHSEIHILLTPVKMTLRRACVMGHPVAHSRSPMIHGYWLKTLGIPGAYELKDLSVEAFPAFITNLAGNGYVGGNVDRKSTRLNSSHTVISYAVFCLKKKRMNKYTPD